MQKSSFKADRRCLPLATLDCGEHGAARLSRSRLLSQFS
jgi:hypothetical protein